VNISEVLRSPQCREGGPVPAKVGKGTKLLQAHGWYVVATRGSHRQFKHPTISGRVTVAGKPSETLPPGTERSILKQAGIEWRRQ